MSDEYVQRYQPISHEQLYQSVQAGDAEQVDKLASAWSAMKDTVDALGRALRQDLDALERTWSGDAGEEFQRRVSLVTQYSASLAGGMAAVHEGLSLMSGPLRSAQREAESPDETDDHDKAIGGALKGALLGPGGAVVGAFAGHQQDKEEREKAHQRMVKVVAELAASYDLSTFDRWNPPPVPPPDTPGGVGDPSYTPRSVGDVRTPGKLPGHGPLGENGTSGPTDLAGSRPGRGTGPGTPGPALDSQLSGSTGPGTSLAGAGHPVGTGSLLAGWAAGAGGVVAQTAGAVRTPGVGGGLPWVSTALPAGGVISASALASGTGGSTTSPARPPAAASGADGRAASGTGRVDAGRQGAAGAGDRSALGGRAGTGRPGTGGAAGALRPGVVGGAPMGAGESDGSDTRSTWLTEDDMDWRGGAEAGPPVLGLEDR